MLVRALTTDRIRVASLTAGLLLLAGPVLAQNEMTHRFLACGQKTYVVEEDGSIVWSYPHATRDGFVMRDERIILTLSKSKEYPGGAVIELAPNGAETIIWRGTQAEINSAQPTERGTFILTEAGPQPRLLEVDHAGKALMQFPLQCQRSNHHMQTRMARILDDGTFLVPHLLDFGVFHYSAKGDLLGKLDTT
ncbi:MAG: hypothetical protein KDB22_25735, partial [Planctomycetales bacterium]|nr:hypothetical protein [Planctomycetales bacterium]